MTPSLIHTSEIGRFGTPARVRRARSQNEVAAEIASMTASITHPPQTGRLPFCSARSSGTSTR